ncbi:RNA-directed DNA polymerase, eukaryota [Tanacetum coccineum]
MGAHYMNSLQSKADQTIKISKSVFVSNFPEGCTAKDLWKVCNDYGTVVDVFIPSKKSKVGKRFAFVRFIKVNNLDRLVKNLNTIWIGRFHLFAIPTRFERPKKSNSFFHNNVAAAPSYSRGVEQVKVKVQTGPYVNVVNGPPHAAVKGVMQFSSIRNLRELLSAEGFNNVKPSYLGGLWVMMELDSSKSKAKFMKHVGVASWFSRLFNAQQDFVSKDRLVWVDIEGVPLHAWSRAMFDKIGAKWGEVMELEESNEDVFARKRICIKTKQEENILEKFKIIVQGKVFVVRAKELFVWSPVVKDVKDLMYYAESDVEGVSETDFGAQEDELVYDQAKSVNDKEQSGNDKEISSDPFNIYSLLNKHKSDVNASPSGTSLSHPPGFTLEKDGHVSDDQEVKMPNQASPQSLSEGLNSRVMQDVSPAVETIISDGHFKDHDLKKGGSILEVLDGMIKVGQAMGFSMGGCLKDMESIIGSQRAKEGLR